MKKITRFLLVFILVAILSLAAAGTAFAGKGGNPKGTITQINYTDTVCESLILQTADGDITVYLPTDFACDTIAAGMYVVVRGDWDGEDVFYAKTVKETTPEDETEPGDGDDDDGDDTGDDDGDDTGDDDDGGEDNGNHQNVFCTGRKDKAHPMVTGIAETYGVDEGEVMNMFCYGYSIGEIMLALQTQQMNGTPAAETLEQRHNGMGWGQIWKEAGLIGNSDHGTPPGQANKPENNGQNGQGKNNPGNGGSPPGQSKKNPPSGDDDDTSGD